MIASTQNKFIRKSFPVTGMSCAGCAASVESMLKSTPGVEDAGVNYANQIAWASFDEGVATVKDLQMAIQSVGYDLIIDVENPLKAQEDAQHKSYAEIKQRTIWSSVLSLPVVIIGMFFMEKLPFSNWISMVLTIPVIFWFGRHFFVGAYKQALHSRANMDTLVALSTGIAFHQSGRDDCNGRDQGRQNDHIAATRATVPTSFLKRFFVFSFAWCMEE
ncbi:MAG: cation-translocating P-type ATPase [Chitinophagaceae bacterium]|nr:MAG: cation-translocating P-type ATPase [Chitinophagaceae bacterium]